MATSKKPNAKPKPLPAPASSDPLAVALPAIANIAAELASFQPTPVEYEPKSAEALLDGYRPRLLAIAPDRLRAPRLNVPAVCGAVLAVHSLTQAPPMLGLYNAATTGGEFDLANLDHLKALPLILQFVHRQADAAGAFASKAKIPAALDTESAEVEGRMQKVCEHFLEDDPEVGPIVRRLSPGTSYEDRAGDLLGYADVYEARLEIVSKDPVHYRKTDVADARRLAGQILSALGATMSPVARQWYDLVLRAFTLLEPVYFEVQELGLRFLRYDPKRSERFPSLYVIGRPGQPRKKVKKEEGKSGGAEDSGT